MIIKFGDRRWDTTGLFTRGSKARDRGSGDEISIGALPSKGRSSATSTFGDGLDNLGGYYDVVDPKVPIEMIEYLALLSIVNPDVSQAVRNLRAMVNTGHKLIVSGGDAAAKKAIEYLNTKAYKIYTKSCGVDGLFEHYVRQIAVSGAISSEDVIAPDFSGVDRVVLVPTASIRFKKDDDSAYQRTSKFDAGQDLIELNPHTYRYFALDLMEDSPYAIPPFLASLDQIPTQRDMFRNVSFLMKKLGLLGLISAAVQPLPREQGETDARYKERNQQYLREVSRALSDNYADGCLVYPAGMELANTAVTGDARGVKDLVQIVEEQVITGLGQDPAMFGRSYSTTETYARVVYEKMITEAGNVRRLVKRRQEETYRLDLWLAGLAVEGISVQFHANQKLDPNVETLAEKNHVSTVLQKAKAGAISPQQAAQELGYDDWYDPELLHAMGINPGMVSEFQWHPGKQQYQYIPHHIDLDRQNNAARTAQLETKEEREARKHRRQVEVWVRQYLINTLPYYDQLSEEVTRFAADFVEENLEAIAEDSTLLKAAVKDFMATAKSYRVWKQPAFQEATEKSTEEAGRWLLTVDRSAVADYNGKFEFSPADLDATRFFAKIDNHYFSKFLDNKDFGAGIDEFVKKFLERGEGLFGNWTAEMEDEFIRGFGAAFKEDLYLQLNRIINSSIGRIQAYSHLEQLYRGGFKYAEVDEVLDKVTCGTCRAMHGKRFLVSRARAAMKKITEADSVEDALEHIQKTNVATEEEAKELLDGDEIKIRDGRGFNPYHVGCRGRMKGVFE